jgi:hypothetical protein
MLLDFGDPNVACLGVRIPLRLIAAEIDANVLEA